MTEKNTKDLERLGRIYQRMARFPNYIVDANDPEDIIIQLDKECEHYRGKIKELHERLISVQGDLNDALNSVSFSQLEAVTQESTLGEIIKATADNGYNISISLYKSEEENSND